MFEEMNKQLEESMEKVFRHRKLLSMLQELTNQQKSLTHLFYSILGKLGEQEEKERMALESLSRKSMS